MEKKVLGGLFQINPVTKTGQRLYMVRRENIAMIVYVYGEGKHANGQKYFDRIREDNMKILFDCVTPVQQTCVC